MQQKTFLVSISGHHAIRRFRTMRKAYSYLLWYSDRISAHFDYVISDSTGRVVEEDTL